MVQVVQQDKLTQFYFEFLDYGLNFWRIDLVIRMRFFKGI